MSKLKDYANKYRNISIERRDGILQMTLHTDGGSLKWGKPARDEFISACNEIGADRENRVVILTGTGDSYCSEVEFESYGDMGTPGNWDINFRVGHRIPLNLLDIEVPVIAAVNGPARMHAHLPLLCDIVLAAETAVFQDAPYFVSGLVPGAGSALVWPFLLGMNRARYFLLTGQELSAREALDLGVVNEVVAKNDLVPRAWELAKEIAEKPILTLRYTRVLLTQELRRIMREGLGYGIALEGLAFMDAPSE